MTSLFHKSGVVLPQEFRADDIADALSGLMLNDPKPMDQLLDSDEFLSEISLAAAKRMLELVVLYDGELTLKAVKGLLRVRHNQPGIGVLSMLAGIDACWDVNPVAFALLDAAQTSSDRAFVYDRGLYSGIHTVLISPGDTQASKRLVERFRHCHDKAHLAAFVLQACNDMTDIVDFEDRPLAAFRDGTSDLMRALVLGGVDLEMAFPSDFEHMGGNVRGQCIARDGFVSVLDFAASSESEAFRSVVIYGLLSANADYARLLALDRPYRALLEDVVAQHPRGRAQSLSEVASLACSQAVPLDQPVRKHKF